MKTKALLISIILFISVINSSHSQIVINEFLASNATTIHKLTGNDAFSDWIELYNTSNTPIDLNGYFLSDDLSNPTKFQISNSIIIDSNSFIIIWADGFNEIDNFGIHTNFKLSKSGEQISIANTEGEIIDSVNYGQQFNDIPYGRKPDATGNWFYFAEPTPAYSNIFDPISKPKYTSEVQFSTNGGFFYNQQIVTLSTDKPNAVIHYTTDCTNPNSSSNIYSEPLLIDTTVIIRAKVFETDHFPSLIKTNSYIFNEHTNNLPTIALSAFPNTLWDDNTGIYTNSLRGFEIPANFEYFENDNEQKISQLTDIRLSGQASSAGPQKPFTVSAKSKYNADYLDYKFFSTRENTQFKDLYLRTSGTPDAFYTMMRDGTVHDLTINKTDIDCQAYQPSKLYLNGAYWGIYNIREKNNLDYLIMHHQVNPDYTDILEYRWSNTPVVEEGSSYHYNTLLDFIYSEENSMIFPANYNYVASLLDINSFIDYMIFEIYIANIDWLNTNMLFWKENKMGKKWRWILLDTDVSYGMNWDSYNYNAHYNFNGLIDATSNIGIAKLFKYLLKNDDFKNQFINKFTAQLNTIYSSKAALNIIEKNKNRIATEMPYHIERWKNFTHPHYGDPLETMEQWETNVEIMKTFAENRPSYQKQHLTSFFNLSEMDSITFEVEPIQKGNIYVYDHFITDSINTGEYFTGISTDIQASAKPGYKFAFWKNTNDTNQIINRIEIGIDTLIAVFEPDNQNYIPSVITSNYELTQENSPYFSSGDITIQANAKLIVEAGVTIKMFEKSNIFIFGTLELNGSATNPIIIKESSFINTKNWGGLCFDSGTGKSILNHVQLINGTCGSDLKKHFSTLSSYNTNLLINGLTINGEKQPFYSEYGKIEIHNSFFHSSVASDLINIKYADSALVENSKLIGNGSYDADAIDYDNLSGGIIRNNIISGFTGYNSDGIDLGEDAKNILIEGNTITNCIDKGISIGQASTAIIKNNIISYCGQGVGIKDYYSFGTISNNTFYENDIAVACFVKNYGDGGGSAIISNCIFANSRSSSHYVDEYSSIIINYSLSNTEQLTGIGNFFSSPEFVDEIAFNFELSSLSPCIDAGDPLSPLDEDGTLADMGASFSYTLSDSQSIIINEINYNSSDTLNSGDWVEIYNSTDSSINLSGWSIMDSKNDNTFSFIDGIILHPKSYFVVHQNDTLFSNIYSNISNRTGDLNFKLSNKSDIVRIISPQMQVINAVNYNDELPWPTLCDGNGYTLELRDETFDNSLAENWRSSPLIGGSPGISNNQTINADYKYNILSDCSGHVQFYNLTLNYFDSILWDFGNGDFSNLNYVDYYYNEPGVYNITLTVYSYFGIDTKTETIELYQTISPPLSLADSSCIKTSFTFTINGTNQVNWYESIDDTDPFLVGNTFTTPELSISKTYYASYSNEICESKKNPIIAYIHRQPTSYFTFEQNENIITTKNHSIYADSYIWDFDDGTTSTLEAPMHEYFESGNYYIRLKALNSVCGFENEYLKIVSISVGVKESQQVNNLEIYPNPAHNWMNIKIPQSKNKDIIVRIRTLMGSVIKIQTGLLSLNNEFLINTSDMEKGIYIIEVTNGNNRFTKRLIII
ncbi:MAG: CotH kinase family protein [Salinivirgaceae bacterium]|nr:CotH kinase family protein [Salinivirgaceae bacterium]